MNNECDHFTTDGLSPFISEGISVQQYKFGRLKLLARSYVNYRPISTAIILRPQNTRKLFVQLFVATFCSNQLFVNLTDYRVSDINIGHYLIQVLLLIQFSDWEGAVLIFFHFSQIDFCLQHLPHPRTIKSHLPFSLLPSDLLDKCKVGTNIRFCLLLMVKVR